MTTEQNIKLEYIHALSEILMDMTVGNHRINVLVSLIHEESKQEEQTI